MALLRWLLAGSGSSWHRRHRTAAHHLSVLAMHLVVHAAWLVCLVVHLPHVATLAMPLEAAAAGAFGLAAWAFGLADGFFSEPEGADAPSG
jgi:Flp pilus assembly protein TadB